MRRTIAYLTIVTVLMSSVSIVQAIGPRPGWQAQLSTLAHGVEGTVTIIDDQTLQVDHFNYDGLGIAVYFYLGVEDTNVSFTNGIGIGSDLVGPAFQDDTLVLTLPPGERIGDYGAISVWCVPAQANFGSGSFACPSEQANYRVTFEGNWNSTDHPTDFPFGNDHFSGIIGGLHNCDVSFWTPYTYSSTGIKNMAERGSKTALTAEINAAISAGTASAVLSGGGLRPASNNSTSLDFTVDSCFPLVTLTSMIAPSPDWFVGVHDMPLYENGAFRPYVRVPLFPWDAGTDDGMTFNSSNAPSNPQQVNHRLAVAPFEQTTQEIAPLGWFIFEQLGTCAFAPAGDINGDCAVNIIDMRDLSVDWLTNCSGSLPLDPVCF